jgi:predicted membrane GTPase involved in stress response
MIIGIHQRGGDLSVNVCKSKQLTNMRSAGAFARTHPRQRAVLREDCDATATDRPVCLCASSAAALPAALPDCSSLRHAAGKDKDDGVVPFVDFSLDACIEYINDDELVEVTPQSIRMLKNPEMIKKKGGRSG